MITHEHGAGSLPQPDRRVPPSGDGVDSRADLPDGIGEALSGRASGSPGFGRRLLDRPLSGHQRRCTPDSSKPPDTSRSRRFRRTPHSIRARCPRCSIAGSLVFVQPGGPVDRRDMRNWWHFLRGRLAPPARAGQSIDGREQSSGRARDIRRRRSLRGVGRQVAADRGRMGARRTRRTRRRCLRVGGHVPAGRPPYGEHVAGPVPLAEPRRSTAIERHLAGRRVSRERLRAPRHDRQRVGVDDRLVCPEASERSGQGLLHAAQSARAARGRQLRSAPAGDPHPPQGHQGRLAPLRAELLPPLPAGGALPRTDRHVHLPSRLPLYRASREAGGSRWSRACRADDTARRRASPRSSRPSDQPEPRLASRRVDIRPESYAYSGRMSIRKRPDRDHAAHLQGTLDLLILRTLIFGPQHGQGIARAIQRESEDVLIVDHGSLYPALQRLEERGFIDAEWGTSDRQPQGALLHADAEGPQGARPGGGRVAAHRRRHHAGARTADAQLTRPGEPVTGLRRRDLRCRWRGPRRDEPEEPTQLTRGGQRLGRRGKGLIRQGLPR